MKKYSETTMAFLEALADIASREASLAEALVTSGLAPYALVYERFNEIMRRKVVAAERRRLKSRFYDMVRRLKENRIIERKGERLILTDRGRKALGDLKDYYGNICQFRSYSAFSKKSDKTIVVIFDIPEKWREKRNWLRLVLIELGYAMLQKSVWKGEYSIPEQLLIDLKNLSLLPYVKFFTAENMVEL
jgi:hypothetical protein